MSTRNWAEDDSSEDGSLNIDEETVDENPVIQETSVRTGDQDRRENFERRNYRHRHDSYESRIVRIFDLNLAATRADVGNFFRKNGCEIGNLDLLTKENRSTGVAIMELKDTKSFQQALNLTGQSILGVSFKTEQFSPNSKVQRQSGRSRHESNRRNLSSHPSHFSSGSKEKSEPSALQQPGKLAMTSTPASRPKLNLKPRTLPLEEIGKTVAKPDIFGDGKPHDETVYQVRNFF